MRRRAKMLADVQQGGRMLKAGSVVEAREGDLAPLVMHGLAAWTDDAPDHPGPLAGIDWASDRGAEVAAEIGLTAADFHGIEPTGAGGYTVEDVKRAAKRVDPSRED